MKKTLLLMMLTLSICGLAQTNKIQAIQIVMDSVVGNDSANVNVYMEPLVQTNAFYVTSHNDSIQSPYANYWLFFIDDKPEYLWYHACRFVFVNATNGLFQSVSKQKPPARLFKYYEDVSLTIDDQAMPVHANSCHAATPIADTNNGKYAVLFCCDNHNYEVFWNSIVHMYCALIEQGYPKENIYVLAHSGDTDTNPKMDLDDDGLPDILPKPCDSINLCAVFDTLTQRMVDGDILYVLAMAHGGRNENQEMEILLWGGEGGGEPFKSTSFANLFRELRCSAITVNIQACYAGYLVDDLLDSIPSNTKYSILPCVGFSDYRRNQQFTSYTGMDVYPFLSCSALRGHYPDSCALWDTVYRIGSNPYFMDSLFHKEERNYDITWGNNNGLHEIKEIIQFCKYDFNNFDSIIPLDSYNCGFVEDLLSIRGITGNVTHSQTINGSFHIEDNFNVTNNADLNVEANSKLFLFDASLYVSAGASLSLGNNTSIVARSGNCHVYICGDIDFGENVNFWAEDGATLEIIFGNLTEQQETNAVGFRSCVISSYSNSGMVLDHCSFDRCQINPTGDFIISNCSLTESSIMAETPSNTIYKRGIVSNCSISNLTKMGISIVKYMDYSIYGNTISANNHPGLFLSACGLNLHLNPQIHNNTVSGCSVGILAYSSRGAIHDNYIHGNAIGLHLDNISNMSVYGSQTGDGQRIVDNSGFEVYASGNSFPGYFKYNRIVDEDNTGNPDDPLLKYSVNGSIENPSLVFDVENNYWGNCFVASEDLNPCALFDYDPIWSGRGTVPIECRLFQLAEDALSSEHYKTADSLYRRLISEYPNSSYAQSAMKQLLFTETLLQNGYDQLKGYYLHIPDTALLVLADNLANKCDEVMKNWPEAIAWYENVIQNPATYEDSVYAVIDLGNLYLEMDSTRSIIGRMRQYQPLSKKQHYENTMALLANIPKENIFTELNKDFQPINNLEASMCENDSVLLTWDFPIGDNSEITLSWSNMNVDAYFGAQAGQCATDQCQLFDRKDLRGLAGWKFKEISTILSPYDTLFPPLGNYYFKIWKGDENNLALVYEQPIDNPLFNMVIAHNIDSVIMVDSDEELRIGYYMDWYADYPWVVDDLPKVDEDKGGRIRYYRDWNPTSECRPIEWENLRSGNLCISSTLTCPDGAEGIAQGITGYRIYRDGTLVKEIPYSFVTYFTDTEFTRETDVEYCVTAVYGDEESEPVCATVTITGIEEAPKIDGITVSPNPTTGIVRIEGATVAEVQVYNALGQLLKTVRNSNEINLKGQPQGIYTLHVTNEDGNRVNRKVVKE